MYHSGAIFHFLLLDRGSWIGVHNALKRQIPNSDFVFRMVSVWLIHILIPFLLLTTIACIPLNSPSTSIVSCARRSFVITCVSPIMVITQSAEVLPHMATIANRLRLWSAFRKEAEQDASEALASAISIDTALRNSQCNLYFPAPVVQWRMSGKRHCFSTWFLC